MNRRSQWRTEAAYRTGVMPGWQQATPGMESYRPTDMMQSWLQTADMMQQVYQSMTQPLMDNLDQMYTSLMEPWTRAARAPQSGTRRHRHKHDCDCDCHEDGLRDCGHDRCECRCCIGDADLVVYARQGERRLVPIVIENARRRDRQITLDLSRFSGRQGAPQVTASILAEQEFTLAACSERIVILVIEAGGARSGTGAQDRPVEVVQGEREAIRNHEFIRECEVLYGDLRIEGCDIRPVRIALALLPFDCDAHPVRCGCGCC
jgi:hypothetical protein